MENKEKALENFIGMIQNSWTYGKMTKEEKEKLLELFNHIITKKALKGDYFKRWETLQAIYYSYLVGLGYNSFNWREESGEK